MACRRSIILVFLASIAVPRQAAAQAPQGQDLAAIVLQQYPQTLVEESIAIDGREPQREHCFAVLEASPSGAPQVVVAGYTNLLSGAVRVLRATAAGFEVAAQTGDEDISGQRCEVEVIDLDNDGSKEAVVRFLARNSSVDWVFRWDDGNLRNLSPMSSDAFGLMATRLINTSFADIDGDRVMEAFTFSEPPREGQPHPGELYRLSGGSYVMERPIVDMRAFERAPGTPETEAATILLPIGAVGPFTLRIINGAGGIGSAKRAESGRVWWNGQEIVRSNHFGEHVDVIERTVTLHAENELKVRLAGSAGERMVVIIDAAKWTP